MKQLPKITKKQQEILQLIYQYRFINRIQIQSFMHHKDYKTINMWLKDLREKDYIAWIYSTYFTEKTKPAIYYLSINGIRHLKQLTYTANNGREYYTYPRKEIRKRYRDKSLKQPFIHRSIILADCCLALQQASSPDHRSPYYTFVTQADYINRNNYYHFLHEGTYDDLQPHLCITKHTGGKETNYLLELFDASLPHYRLRYRLKLYFTYLSEDHWEAEGSTNQHPVALLVLPSTYHLIYAKRKIRKLKSDLWDDDEKANIRIRFTTTDQLQQYGILSPIWEEGRYKYGL